ncbi:hypothetical protein ACSQ67_023491 [Phaseolus vulgaris]
MKEKNQLPPNYSNSPYTQNTIKPPFANISSMKLDTIHDLSFALRMRVEHEHTIDMCTTWCSTHLGGSDTIYLRNCFQCKSVTSRIPLSQSSTSSNDAVGEMLGNKDLGLRLLGGGIESN